MPSDDLEADWTAICSEARGAPSPPAARSDWRRPKMVSRPSGERPRRRSSRGHRGQPKCGNSSGRSQQERVVLHKAPHRVGDALAREDGGGEVVGRPVSRQQRCQTLHQSRSFALPPWHAGQHDRCPSPPGPRRRLAYRRSADGRRPAPRPRCPQARARPSRRSQRPWDRHERNPRSTLKAILAPRVELQSRSRQSIASSGSEWRSRCVGPASIESARAASATVRSAARICSSDSQPDAPGAVSSRQPG